MPLGDLPVRISSQVTTFRRTMVVGQASATTLGWFVQDLPRINVSGQQTVGGVAATLTVQWAIRDSSTPSTPEWLNFQAITLVGAPGLTPPTLLTIGAVWVRFLLTGIAGDTCQLAASAFV